MRRLVFIHGRSQEHKNPDELKAIWLKALNDGLNKSGLTLPMAEADVAFPYYGDTLDQLQRGAAEVILRGPSSNEEQRFVFEMMEEMRIRAGITEDQVLDEIPDKTITRGPLNWGWVQGIMCAFDKHVPDVSGIALSLFTHDVYVYLRRPGIMDKVNAIVRRELPDEQETIVVAHSLGTVIAFSVLNRDQAKLKIPLLTTVGSPLAIKLIQSAFIPFDSVSCIDHWYNAMDPRDFVALYPLAPPDFNVEPVVENKTNVNNFTSNRHGIIGYLSDKEVAKHIYDGLTG